MTLNRGKEADLEKGLDPNDMESDGIGKKSEDASNSNKCEGTAQPARESPPQESEHPGTASRNKHPVNLRRDPCTTPSGSSAKPVEDTAPLERQEEKTAIDLIPNNRGAVAALVGRFPRHSRSRLLDGDGAIGHLHRINVVNARLALYKDYIRICGGRETGSWDEDVRILQENISRYC
jgi:hypothetical protein